MLINATQQTLWCLRLKASFQFLLVLLCYLDSNKVFDSGGWAVLSSKKPQAEMLQLKTKHYKAKRRAQLKATVLLVCLLLLALVYVNV